MAIAKDQMESGHVPTEADVSKSACEHPGESADKSQQCTDFDEHKKDTLI
jgi:hypothetical protein